MSLPTLTKSWNFSLCQLQATQATNTAGNQLSILNLINTFLNMPQAWTVDYSCNSVTAGTLGDGVNRITTTANVVLNIPGSAHSWIVLKPPSGLGNSSFRLLISAECLGYDASTHNTVLLAVSFSAGFTGGTTTARPTSTDGFVLGTFGSNSGAGPSWIFGGTVSGSTGPYRISRFQSTDGVCNRIIFTSGASAQFHLLIDGSPNNVVSGWSNPVTVFLSNGAGPTTAITGWGRANSTDTTLVQLSEGNASGTWATQANGAIANDIDGNWPIFTPSVAGTTSGARGRHGTMIDLWHGSSGVLTSDSYNASGSLQFVQFGNLIYPWDGSTSVLLS